MKTLFLLVALASLPAVAADFPAATDRIADCENRWFLLAGRDPETRILGFAYVDPTAGVTFEHNGDVSVTADGALERKPLELMGKARLIARVGSNLPIVCLSEGQRDQLGLPANWEWLEVYKDSRAPGPHNVAWASHYNHIGAFDRAFKHIELAQLENYQSRDLTFEHGFALNAVSRYLDALAVLEPGVKAYPQDVNIRAELAYAHLGLGDFAKAIDIYERAYSMDKNGASGRKAEFAQNIAAAHSRLGNDREVSKWLALAQKEKAKK